jgi:hypothetical protein
MSDENQNPPSMPPGGPDNEGPDEPIRELRDLERDTTPGFLSRIRRKIYRRAAVSHVATFSWQIPKVILLEMVGMLGHILNAFGARKGSER